MKLRITSGAAFGLLAAATVPAQEQPGTFTIEEIIVTATKREENLQQVSVAVTALPAAQLRERSIVDPREIIYLSPSIQLAGSNSNNSEGYSIRGVGTAVFGSGLQQSVAAVIDGVSVRPTDARQSFVDLERVEILRGPQGMLFGKNASAGLVSIVTKRPVFNDYSGELYASYGDASSFDERTVQVAGNLPLGSSAALRVASHYADRDGFIRNLVDGRRLNQYRDAGVKAKLLWAPSETFSAYLIADYSDQDDPFRIAPIVNVEPGGAIEQFFLDYGVTHIGPKNDKAIIDGPVFGRTDYKGVSLQLDWELGAHTLTSISSWRESDREYNLDTDSTPVDLFNTNYSNGTQGSYTQELRLTSGSDARIQYVAGLYYEQLYSNGRARFAGALVPDLIPLGLKFDFTFGTRLKSESYAAFGQAEIPLTERSRAVLGARYTLDEISLHYSSQNLSVLPFPGFPEVEAYTEEADASAVSWKVGLEHDFSRAVMGYATVARGYKGPGFNTLAIAEGERQYIAPETVMSYELGLKSTIRHSTRLNVAAFYSAFDDYQANVVDTSGFGPVGRILVKNAGSLETYGLEIELTAQPTDGLFLNAGLAYIEATYDDFPNQSCYPLQTPEQGCIDGLTDASGNDLVNSPKWVLTTAAKYERPLTSSLRGFVSANYYWRDRASMSVQGDPNKYVDSYGILGASIGLASAYDTWRATLWVKNLLDERFPSSIIDGVGTTLSGDPADYAHYRTHDAFRTVGVSFSMSF